MSNHRKKPVVIQAIQWDGTESGCQKIKDHFPQLVTLAQTTYSGKPEVSYWKIGTLEGGHEVTPGDWIIQGVKGELYPCKPDIFAATYEPAETTPSSPSPALAVEPMAFSVRCICCGLEDGRFFFPTWKDADDFRNSYTSGISVHPNGYSTHPSEPGHRRAAIIEAIYTAADLEAYKQRAVNEALDLLDILFSAYEDGLPCEEVDGGYGGNAVDLDEETFDKIADLLNRERPRVLKEKPND